MARHEAFGAQPRQSVRDRLAPLAVLPLAALLIAGGLDQLVHHFESLDPRPYRAASGVALVLSGAVAAATAVRLRRSDAVRQRLAWIVRAAGLRYAIVGAGLSFFAAVALGPDPNVRYLFRGALGLWLAAPLAAAFLPMRPLGPSTRVSRLIRSGPTAALIVFAALATAEVGLRLASGRRLVDSGGDAAPLRRLEPGRLVGGRAVNPQGYWDEEFQPRQSAKQFRVAVLGGRQAIGGGLAWNFVDRIERGDSDVEALNFGLPVCGVDRLASQFVADVAPYEPDLVVAVIEVAGDIARPRCQSHAFDWRRWSVLKSSASMVYCDESASPFVAPPTPNEVDDLEVYLAAGCRRMAVCRRPIPDGMEDCWQAAFASLDELAAACVERGTPLALALAPEDFQINSVVCDILRRRSGAAPEQLDLEMPQRRLHRYAEERGLPVIDLLPLFRARGTALYVRNCTEWNEAGHEAASGALAGWLKSRYGSTNLAHSGATGR